MNYRTGGNYGVNETLLASSLAALAFSIFAVQPLTIVGVTGLINLFNYTTFDILEDRAVFLQFQAWAVSLFWQDLIASHGSADPLSMLQLIWSAISHWIVAIFNISDYSRFITDCTSETFGLCKPCFRT